MSEQEFLRKHAPRTTREIKYNCKKCKTEVIFYRDLFKKEQPILEEKQIRLEFCQSCFIKYVSGGLKNGL